MIFSERIEPGIDSSQLIKVILNSAKEIGGMQPEILITNYQMKILALENRLRTKSFIW